MGLAYPREEKHAVEIGATEVLLDEWTADLVTLAALPTLECVLTGIVSASGGAAAVRVRVGGVAGTVSGSIASEIATTGTTDAQRRGAGAVANPGAQALVKLTCLPSSTGRTYARGLVVRFR